MLVLRNWLATLQSGITVIGTEAIFLKCSYTCENLNLHKVYAYVLAPNLHAPSSFEKVEFIEEGVLKENCWMWNYYSMPTC